MKVAAECIQGGDYLTMPFQSELLSIRIPSGVTPGGTVKIQVGKWRGGAGPIHVVMLKRMLLRHPMTALRTRGNDFRESRVLSTKIVSISCPFALACVPQKKVRCCGSSGGSAGGAGASISTKRLVSAVAVVQ